MRWVAPIEKDTANETPEMRLWRRLRPVPGELRAQGSNVRRAVFVMANSASDARSSEMELRKQLAANATLALNAAMWFLLGRFIPPAPIKVIVKRSSSTTYRPVQFCGASSYYRHNLKKMLTPAPAGDNLRLATPVERCSTY